MNEWNAQPTQESRTDVERAEAGREAYERYVEVLSGAERILREGNPARWWHRLYKYFATQRATIATLPKEYSESVVRQLDEALVVLRAQASAGPTGRTSDYQTAAQNAIHDMAHALHTAPEVREASPMHAVSWETLTAASPDVRMERRGSQAVVFVRPDGEADWAEFPMPRTDRVIMKGGLPRIMLKNLVGAPHAFLAAEFPVNDVDIIATAPAGEQDAIKAEALELGADATGLEWVDDVSDVAHLAAGRDIDLNQCFLTKDGLVYSERAAQAARTGTISALAGDRGLYGIEYLHVDGVRLINSRAFSRLLKFAAEGKAGSFEFLPLNRQLPLGVYWLVLARKFMAKRNGPELLERLHALGAQIGQVREGETPMETLDRVHAESPFFRVSDGPLDDAGVTKWLSNKLKNLAERAYRRQNQVRADRDLVRVPGDTVPYRVSLENYAPNVALQESIREQWSEFVARCDARTRENANASERQGDAVQLAA
ncbi:MAG: hypothetical protein WCO25_03520 [Candidatus Uhrbacteria bacterium]